MDFPDLVARARSVRRFYGLPLTLDTLRELVNLARLSPCAGNLQTLRYRLVADAEGNARVYPALGWAGYLKDWDGPAPKERPGGYIIMLRDTRPGKSFPADEGIAAQSIFLGAAARGLGGCFIANIDRPRLARALGLDTDPRLEHYDVALVIALGYPKEKVTVEELAPGDGDADIRYYRDAGGGHHVPKRALDDLLL